jgi:hypothetical protein
VHAATAVERLAEREAAQRLAADIDGAATRDQQQP